MPGKGHRFMFLIELDYPSEAEEIEIARTTTGDALPALKHLLTASQIIAHQRLVRRIPVPDHIYAYATRLVRRTRPKDPSSPSWLKPLVAWGAGPRAVQNLILGGKARAALLGSGRLARSVSSRRGLWIKRPPWR